MTAFLIANIAPLMFVALIVVLLIGYPVAFSLAAVGIVFGLLGIELGLLHAVAAAGAAASASGASCRTTRCSRCRSSPSWA